jgi:hypothetical protein
MEIASNDLFNFGWGNGHQICMLSAAVLLLTILFTASSRFFLSSSDRYHTLVFLFLVALPRYERVKKKND